MTKLTLVAVLVAVVGSACGTPCSRIANGEAAANDKGTACQSSTTPWTSSRISSCEAGLKKCSADDQKWLDTYADCLQKLPTCAEGQSLSWNVQRVTCAQSLFSVSASCSAAIQ